MVGAGAVGRAPGSTIQSLRSSVELEGRRVQILGPIDPDEHRDAFLAGIAILL